MKTKLRFRKTISLALSVMIVAICIIIYIRIPKYGTISSDSIVRIAPNQEVVIPIIVNTHQESVNAAEAHLKFDNQIIEVLEIVRDDSIFTLWIDPIIKIDNDIGIVSLGGGLPNPGFSGKEQIAGLKIKLKQAQKTQMNFLEQTRALKNDGQGTEIKLITKDIIIYPK